MYSLSDGRDFLSSLELVQGLVIDELETRLSQSLRLGDTGQRALAFYLADMDERGLHQERGFCSIAFYAESRLDLNRRRTSELVAAGRSLLELRSIDRAFCAGDIGWSKVQLLLKVASPEHEEAWLARARALSRKALRLEVRLSKPGRAPRKAGDRKGLPETRFRIAAAVGPLVHQKLELTKQKLTAELGHAVGVAECLELMADLLLGTEEDGTVPGRNRVDASLYRIHLRPEGDDDQLAVDTEEGPIPLTEAACLRCDAATVDAGDVDQKTPPKLRKQVLARDGSRCCCCGSRWSQMVHHIKFLSHGGRTVADNLITLCSSCHGLVHDELLVLEGERADEVQFVDRAAVRLSDADRSLARNADMALVPAAEASTTRTPEIVTLDSLPDVVGGDWWTRHGHLIRFRSGKGLEFQTGTALPDEDATRSQSQEPPQPGSRTPFEGLVGQDARVARLLKTAASRRRRGQAFPHTVFEGPAGTGKTTFARGVAQAVGARLVSTSGPLLTDTHALVRVLANLGKDDCFFIDEIHAVPRPVLETLYEAMSGTGLDLTLHAGARARSIRLALPRFTLLAATTERGDLPTALRSRFGLRESLGFYAPEDLAAR